MIAGIVCEYNPFHNGHLHHINKTKQAGAEYIVCVMSGNFVQRGECAYLDKWCRAEAAVRCGADVVIDLPVPWACSSAEDFARGSVGLLADFGTDILSFGSESDDRELLIKCAEAVEDGLVRDLMKNKMSQGCAYPVALSEAVGEVYGLEAKRLLSSPNSTLAVEYIRAVRKENTDIDILPIKRIGADHDSEKINEGFASASKIRSLDSFDKSSELIPEEAYCVFEQAIKNGNGPYKLAYGERAVLSALREMSKSEYSLYTSDSSGLSDRLYSAVKDSSSLEEIYGRAKSKNYTHSRIRREVMSLYLKIPKEISKGRVPYMRILAVSDRGLSLLSKAKENSSVPVLTRHSEYKTLTCEGKKVYDIQCSCSDKFTLFGKNIGKCSLEQVHSMKKVNTVP